MKHRASSFNAARANHLHKEPHELDPLQDIQYKNLTDSTNLIRNIQQVQLDEIFIVGITHKTRIYQASTSELYGLVQEIPQAESTPFYARYHKGFGKLYGYWITVNYRKVYGMYG